MEIYEIDFKKRLWAIFIFSSLAGVVCQISSTQTDLVVGALLLLSFYFIIRFKKECKISDLFFSSLCMGIGFGVKSPAVIGSLPLLIYYCYLIRKDIVKYILFLSLNFIIFSSYNYILNFIDYGNFLGNNASIISHRFWGGYKAIIGNFIRYILQFLDFSGLNLAFYLKDFIFNLEHRILDIFNIPYELGVNIKRDYIPIRMSEHIIGFGVLGFLVFMPAVFLCLFKKNLRLFSLLFFGQILVLSFAIAYMIYSIRFITAFVALAIPVLSITYFKKMNVYKFMVIFYAVFYMGYSCLFLSERPFEELYKLATIKKIPLVEIQEKLRDYVYFMPEKYNEAVIMKKIVNPICSKGNKIGVFANSGYRLYPAKYLELYNNCKVEFINAVNIKETENYNYLISPSNFPQNTNVFNNTAIKIPENIQCKYKYKDKEKNITDIFCKIEDDFFKNKGYVLENIVTIEVFPLETENRGRTIENYSIWRKE